MEHRLGNFTVDVVNNDGKKFRLMAGIIAASMTHAIIKTSKIIEKWTWVQVYDDSDNDFFIRTKDIKTFAIVDVEEADPDDEETITEVLDCGGWC